MVCVANANEEGIENLSLLPTIDEIFGQQAAEETTAEETTRTSIALADEPAIQPRCARDDDEDEEDDDLEYFDDDEDDDLDEDFDDLDDDFEEDDDEELDGDLDDDDL